MKLRIGIFLGGRSREREISFAGGRTVYDNLDKNLFEPVPVFIDSNNQFILLNWEFLYKGTIRDFYPPAFSLLPSKNKFRVYIDSLEDLSTENYDQIISAVGRKIDVEELKGLMDVAFLALHGEGGEDGSIQGLLEYLEIPYTGSGILPSAIGMDKSFQKSMMKAAGIDVPKSIVIKRNDWLKKKKKEFFSAVKKIIGFPAVVRPANQGSSIGVSVLHKKSKKTFEEAVDRAFFLVRIPAQNWNKLDEIGRVHWLNSVCELKDGIGIPFYIGEQKFFHPEVLLEFLNDHFKNSDEEVLLESMYEEREVIVEEFIDGTEFSCIVIRNEDGKPVALPPTEIRKPSDVYDYRSKYLPGISRKVTPIEVPDKHVWRIRKSCEQLYEFFGFNVYARIDGFVRSKDKKIFLNDPNTTSGMLPSSFFFHQAAEIGLNPSQFLTFVIHASLIERSESDSSNGEAKETLKKLDGLLAEEKNTTSKRKKIGVILGGYSSERHISVESGRNVYEKLSSSSNYEAIPLFLVGNKSKYSLHRIPINFLLKDNADDIRDKILSFEKNGHVKNSVIEKIRSECKDITKKFAAKDVLFTPVKIPLESLKSLVDGVFIALHGRPGEDGQVQQDLEKLGIPYNGSGVSSSQLTIDKYATNELLQKEGMLVPKHALFSKQEWQKDAEEFYQRIISQFQFPFIAKPVDDGCSSAVKKINSPEELQAFCHIIFRDHEKRSQKFSEELGLKPNEEFPLKQNLLIEELITANGAKQFLEITGGMLSRLNGDGKISLEIFEPSEVLASKDVLSLEEKFLAGEGQNITPARFSEDVSENIRITSLVKDDLKRAAQIAGVEGYCRIDAFVRIYEDGKVETIILEINSLPGMTPATAIFHQAAIHHYTPFSFIDRILEFSFDKREHVA